jgi:hypothetical protein
MGANLASAQRNSAETLAAAQNWLEGRAETRTQAWRLAVYSSFVVEFSDLIVGSPEYLVVEVGTSGVGFVRCPTWREVQDEGREVSEPRDFTDASSDKQFRCQGARPPGSAAVSPHSLYPRF